MKRREFLGGLLALGGWAALRPALGAARRTPRLVAIHLFGGNDGLNTVVPWTDPLYRKARPTLALGRQEVEPLRSGLALHAALRPLLPLWQRGKLAILQGVGYADPNRSHFISSDIWQTGAARGNTGDGWLGRLAAQERWELVQVDDKPLCRALWTPPGSPGIPVCVHPDAQAAPAVPAELDAQLTRLYSASPQLGPTFQRMQQVRSRRRSCPGERWQGEGIGQSLATILDLWSLGRVFHTSVGGFDTHGDQRARQARVLGELAHALSGFYTELQRRGWENDTTVLVYSEFGRRVAENGSSGTDHGGAGPVLLLGGGVKGGLYGEHPSLSDLCDGDLRHGLDFRQVYASVLEGALHTDSAAILGGSFGTIPCWA